MSKEQRWWFVIAIWYLWNKGDICGAYTVASYAEYLLREADSTTSLTIG